MALFRAAAAAGILFVLAPDETRNAVAAILFGAEDLKRSLPTREELTDAAMAQCKADLKRCAEMAKIAAETTVKIKP